MKTLLLVGTSSLFMRAFVSTERNPINVGDGEAAQVFPVLKGIVKVNHITIGVTKK